MGIFSCIFVNFYDFLMYFKKTHDFFDLYDSFSDPSFKIFLSIIFMNLILFWNRIQRRILIIIIDYAQMITSCNIDYKVSILGRTNYIKRFNDIR